MEDIKHMVSNILKDMLDEVKGASNYLDMAYKADMLEHKKRFTSMANQELEHYKNLCEMLEEKMRQHPNEVNIENNIVAKTLYEDMRHWKETIHGKVKGLMEELGIK